jgi:putative iron-regulated protein
MRTSLVVLLLAGCKPDPTADVVKHHAALLEANYRDVVSRLESLKRSVDGFVAAPSAAGLEGARQAWLEARPSYGECEVSRFYGGPLDQAQGSMNEWPIDENFIDYTAGNPSGGIINDPRSYPQITPQVLAAATGRGGVENLATGYHAIEFLLWGQRPDPLGGPGQRPYTDYLDGGTASYQDRRRTYLAVAAQMLLDDMRSVLSQWDLSDAQSYGSAFVAAPPDESLAKIYRGFSQMAISELLYERIYDPFITRDRKDEESCFSESTQVDLVANALGVENVYLGRYHALTGPSLTDLIQAEDPALDAEMRRLLAEVRSAIDAIPPPFDHAVLSPPGSPPHAKVQAAIDVFAPLQGVLTRGAQALGVVNNL